MVDRAHGLAVTFVEHMKKRAADHPINDVLLAFARFPVLPEWILSPRLPQLALHHRLSRIVDGEKSSLVAAVKNWYIDRLNDASTWGNLVLDRSCRIEGYGPDASIRLKDDFLRTHAIQWRCNAFLCNFSCPRCQKSPMTRGCVPRCFADIIPDFSLGPTKPVYTLFDFLLNRCRYLEFEFFLGRLISAIS
jgi:hypothetical protein